MTNNNDENSNNNDSNNLFRFATYTTHESINLSDIWILIGSAGEKHILEKENCVRVEYSTW